jgi:opacity protein-like surface antigen
MERGWGRSYNRTMKRFACALIAAVALTAAVASADQNPTKTGMPSPSETAFVTAIQQDLMARYPTAADAERAGYIRYTNEDETGAISYANLQWQSADPKHPSKL